MIRNVIEYVIRTEFRTANNKRAKGWGWGYSQVFYTCRKSPKVVVISSFLHADLTPRSAARNTAREADKNTAREAARNTAREADKNTAM